MEEDYSYTLSKKDRETDPPPHYYGDTVRVLFLIAGIALMIITATYRDTVNVPVSMSMLGAIILVLSAGFTAYKQHIMVFVDFIVALFSTFFFESIVLYGSYNRNDSLFWIYQGLALIFLVALYFSVKTLRNSFLR